MKRAAAALALVLLLAACVPSIATNHETALIGKPAFHFGPWAP